MAGQNHQRARNQRVPTSVVGPGHCGILVVVSQGSLTRPIASGMTRACGVSHPSTPSTAAAAMSSVKGGYDEVEYLYSKPPYVFRVSSGVYPGNR